MKTRFITTSFALALLSATAAHAQTQPGTIVLAQAGGAAQYLSDGRTPSSLTLQELRQRVNLGGQLIQDQSVSRADRQRIRQILQLARAELQKRRGQGNQQAGQKPAAQGDESADQSGTGDTEGQNQAQNQQDQNQNEAGNQQAQANTTGGAGNASAESYIAANSTPPDQLSSAELRQRMQAGRALVQDKSLSRQQRQRVRQIFTAARAELQKQRGGAGNKAAQGQGQGGGNQSDQTQTGQNQTSQNETGQAQQGGQGGSGDATQYLSDTRPLDQMSAQDLRQRMQTGRSLIQGGKLSRADRQRVRQAMMAARTALQKQQAGGGNQAGDEQGGNQQGGNQAGNQQGGNQQGGNQAGDQQGGDPAVILGDNRDTKSLKDEELRQRLEQNRAALRNRQLSPADQRALREKLAADRRELRSRVGKGKPGRNVVVTERDVTEFRTDRRNPGDLNDEQLSRRMQFYRDRLSRKDVSESERRTYREFLVRDRGDFRRRWSTVREERLRDLRRRRDAKQVNVRINVMLPGQAIGVRPPPVWVAEADDEVILQQLTRRPARDFDRRYTFEEVATEPELREEMPAVEIDTIKFGFNESEIREEDLEALDRVGSILEEILAAHPGEVFMIEGHTDAVGSDEYNLDLSRERSASVKAALLEYYDIKPGNLQTYGYGERFLKIPTEEEEEENRRVTVRRITPLVGELTQ